MNRESHYNPYIHHRRSIRLKGYDYSQPGAYFVTICTHHHECLFGEIVGAVLFGGGFLGGCSEPAPTVDIGPHMELNAYGEIVQFTWYDLVNHVSGIELGEFVIMPNHIHGIIAILDHVGADLVGAGSEAWFLRSTAPTVATKKYNLPEIVRQFKTYSARRINEQRGRRGEPVWQRNYWEHIIRDEKSYHEIATYILNNPVNWEMDKLHP
jgi:putative transposase